MKEPQTSFDWIREISPRIKSLDDIPLTGNAPPFPWKELSERLARTFDREGIAIRLDEISWRSEEELYEGIGSHALSSAFSVPSMRGEACLVIPIQEIESLAALFLTKESHPPISIHEHSLIEAFYRFFILEVLYEFNQLFHDKTIVPVLTEKTTLPFEDSLCLDVSLSVKDRILRGRLMLSPDFRSSWVEHFASRALPLAEPGSVGRAADVELHLEAGQTYLSLAEWKTVKEGDFVMLDNCSLDPDTLEGALLLTAKGRPLFKIQLSDGNVKILERPLLHEVQTPMTKKNSDKNEEEDLSDFDLNDSLEDFEELEEADSLFDDIEGDERIEDLSDREKAEEENQDPDNPDEIPSDELSTASEERVEGKSKEILKKVSETDPITSEQIPLVLTVEVGRIRMTVEELLKLEPGNLFELGIHPKNGVDLTVNGMSVGKAELIRIGESLGIRILQLGST